MDLDFFSLDFPAPPGGCACGGNADGDRDGLALLGKKWTLQKKNQYAIEIPRPVCVGGGSALVDVCRRKRQLPQKRSVLAHVNEVQGPRAETRSCGEGGVEGGSDDKGREGQASGE